MDGACALLSHRRQHLLPKKTVKMKASAALAAAFAMVLLASVASSQAAGGLQVGFYRGKCGVNDVEAIIRRVVLANFLQDRTVVAALLRMQFHDCFVKGCDASILLDGNSTEKTAVPNLSVRGYNVIDQAKAAVESACPNLVSCADIIVSATRDSVIMAGGPWYEVQTGRRDGNVSLASNVDLPSPFISVAQSIAAFQKKGLNTTDMVVLLGGHTVGVTHCSFVTSRLYNFQGTGKPDPTMDATLLAQLRATCPQNSTANNSTTVALDQNPFSTNIVDNSYYQQVSMRRGVLQIDQELSLDAATRSTVASLAWGFNFRAQFGGAMVRLGAVQVLTGAQGEIRKNCRAVNKA